MNPYWESMLSVQMTLRAYLHVKEIPNQLMLIYWNIINILRYFKRHFQKRNALKILLHNSKVHNSGFHEKFSNYFAIKLSVKIVVAYTYLVKCALVTRNFICCNRVITFITIFRELSRNLAYFVTFLTNLLKKEMS